MPLDLSEVVNDPDLSEDVIILRSTGKFALGGFKDSTVEVPASGILVPADDQALEQIPEGDRVTGSLQFLTATPIYRTHATPELGNSDKIRWNGDTYRVQSVAPWTSNGFYSAILVRIDGN